MNGINERKNRILALMNDPAFVPMKEKELVVMMQVTPDDRALFRQCLDELVAEGAISVSKRGKYSLPVQKTLEGIFAASGHGYGFVHVEGEDGDFFISEKHTGTAMHGDRVLIEPFDPTPRRRRTGRTPWRPTPSHSAEPGGSPCRTAVRLS